MDSLHQAQQVVFAVDMLLHPEGGQHDASFRHVGAGALNVIQVDRLGQAFSSNKVLDCGSERGSARSGSRSQTTNRNKLAQSFPTEERMNPAREPAPEGPPLLAIDGTQARITLRRPSLRNSLNDEDLSTLLAHFAQVDADPGVRVLVLGADTHGQARPVFSAGYHVGGLDKPGSGPQRFEKIPDALAALRPITVCAMGGSVYGGATDLVLACDLRIALAGGEWRMPAAALGLHYYPSGLRRYVARFGIDLAKRAFLTAQPLPVELLAAQGLFVQLAGRDDFDAAVDTLVAQVAALAPLAAQATKRSLNEIAAGRDDEAAMRERERLTQASADFAEGRRAFAERRPPQFHGR